MLPALVAATIAAGVFLWVELLRQLSHSRHIGRFLRFLCAVLAVVVAVLGVALILALGRGYLLRAGWIGH